jgi:hypothetical protein
MPEILQLMQFLVGFRPKKDGVVFAAEVGGRGFFGVSRPWLPQTF